MRTAIVTTLLLVGSTACASADDGVGADTSRRASTSVDAPDTRSTPLDASSGTGTGTVTTPATPDDDVASPTTDPVTDEVTDPPVTPEGYELVAATVTTADGEVCEVCLWLADTADTRRRGLMGVTDLGAGDGMAFVYPAPHTGTFWMKNTVLPLSIAFFDEQGTYLDAFDMEPCTADPCPVYPTAEDFSVAIETTQGDLGAIGAGPGSRLAVSELPCR